MEWCPRATPEARHPWPSPALLAGMAIWCVVNQKGRFTGNWYWKSGWQVALECRR